MCPQAERVVTPTSDLRIIYNVPLPAPARLAFELPRSQAQSDFVTASRQAIESILNGSDPRFLVIVGPCSIHDPIAGLEYARKLASLREELKDALEIVMRVYFEKPRTSVGWKGLIMDPGLDGSAHLADGLGRARKILRDVIDLGMPTATEFLDPVTPQYISDLVCWAAIGARTVESQTHRQMASGLSMPVGLKNATSGKVEPAVNALKAVNHPQTFFGISQEGVASEVSTSGNPSAHIILRGGEDGPNYSAGHVEAALAQLRAAGLSQSIVIDSSHANCDKDYTRMGGVFQEVLEQRLAGNRHVVGAMLESNLVAGNQSANAGKEDLRYGQSITDPCIAWEETEALLRECAERMRKAIHTS